MSTVRYFAAAEDAAARGEETRTETTLGELRAAVASTYPRLGEILPRCAVLVDGSRAPDDTPLGPSTVVDVLPPFAGG